MTSHPPQFDLDLYFANELADPRRVEVESHLSQCKVCQGYMAELNADNTALMQRKPAEQLAIAVQHAAVTSDTSSKWSLPRWATLVSMLGVAAAGVLLFARPAYSPHPLHPKVKPDTIRFMGQSPSIRVYALRDNRGLLIPPGETPRADDRLQFELIVPPRQTMNVAVFIVEHGEVQAVLPDATEHALSFAEGTHRITGSLVFEALDSDVRVLVIGRTQAFSLAEVRKELQAAATQDKFGQVTGVLYDTIIKPSL